jgi:branched-subunit amino acid transport protein
MTTGYAPITIWAVLATIGAVTYGFRLSFLYVFGGNDTIGDRTERVLRLVPPAVLAALAIPAIVTVRPSVSATVLDERLLAGVAAVAVAWRTEDILATIATGMAVLWILRFLVL